MNVHVSLFANLRDYAPSGRGRFELPLTDGATVADLLAALCVPAAVQAVILVDGRRADAAAPLHDGAEVTLFPPMEGG